MALALQSEETLESIELLGEVNMDNQSKILVLGSTGLVGSAIVAQLQQEGYKQLFTPIRAELDLTDTGAVKKYLAALQPDVVFVAAARVGGILENSKHPVEMLTENLRVSLNVIEASYQAGVQKLLYLGSSCAYPKFAAQPMTEDELLGGLLEPTNKSYALAKICGVTLCESYNRQYQTQYISVMPCNVYGPGDTYDEKKSHVLAAMIRRFVIAKNQRLPRVICWGTGRPLREFIFSRDLAGACVFLMKQQKLQHDLFNIGTQDEVSIEELANRVAALVGFEGEINWDAAMPDGTPRKKLDCQRMNALGWGASVDLDSGIAVAVKDFYSRFDC